MRQHFQKIDFLRGIAVILVFLYHSQESLFPGYLTAPTINTGVIDLPSARNLILNLSPTAYGWSGVTLFLIISGFLIHLGYLKNEGNFNLLTFLSKRFWRIYPPYWLTLLFFSFATGGIWFIFFSKAPFVDFVTHFFTVHNFTDKTFFSINPSYWSLAVEIQLYLLYPAFLYSRNKIGIKITFGLTCLLSVVMILMGVVFNNFGTAFVYIKSTFELWFIWAAGAYYAEVFAKKQRMFNNKSVLIFSLSFLLLFFSKYLPVVKYLSYHIAAFAWLVFIDWFLNKTTLKVKSFVSRSIITLGLCSYSFYLIHQPYLINLINFFNIVSRRHFFKLLNIIPPFFLYFFIAYSLYQFIELPSIAFGKRLRDRKQQSL